MYQPPYANSISVNKLPVRSLPGPQKAIPEAVR